MLLGSRALRWLTPLLLVAAELSFGIPVSVGNIETAKLLKEATLVLKGEVTTVESRDLHLGPFWVSRFNSEKK